MLLDAARDLGLDLSRSWLIGDRWRDIGAGHAAGCYTIFIDLGYDEPLTEAPDSLSANLLEAAAIILRHARLQPAARRA